MASPKNKKVTKGKDQECHSAECACGEEKKIEDPLSAFVYKYRNVICTVLVVCGVGYYAFNQVKTFNLEARQSASDIFEQVRVDLEAAATVTSENEEEAKAALARVEEKLSALKMEKEPYKTLAQAYQTLIAVRRGEITDFESARKALPTFGASKKPFQDAKFFEEMAELLLARAQLDDAVTREAGLKALVALANNAQYVNVQAALTAARLAESEAERSEMKELLGNLMEMQPAFADEIEVELAKL